MKDSNIPKHIAIIMDGNGRWAKKRFLPRALGHKAGVKSLREIIKHSAKIGVNLLTVFAFGRENWARPDNEVDGLMELFSKGLISEVPDLHENNIIFSVIGDRSRLGAEIINQIIIAENMTRLNTGLKLQVAIDYSGTWDISNALKSIISGLEKENIDKVSLFSEELIINNLQTKGQPDVDLLIRTSGEQRISNFMLWQIAYAELYFTNILWPDFKSKDLDDAIFWFNKNERRYGKISEQLK
jgi:undecaprenyl diphosphate synthase